MRRQPLASLLPSSLPAHLASSRGLASARPRQARQQSMGKKAHDRWPQLKTEVDCKRHQGSLCVPPTEPNRGLPVQSPSFPEIFLKAHQYWAQDPLDEAMGYEHRKEPRDGSELRIPEPPQLGF